MLIQDLGFNTMPYEIGVGVAWKVSVLVVMLLSV